jgi:hypothetical protein
MSTQPKKRIVFKVDSIEMLEASLNDGTELGYTVDYMLKMDFDKILVVMRLKTDPSADYSATDDVMLVPIDVVKAEPMGTPMIKKASDEGWSILDIYKGTKDTPSTAVMGRKKQ